jgi:hypothetical protein
MFLLHGHQLSQGVADVPELVGLDGLPGGFLKSQIKQLTLQFLDASVYLLRAERSQITHFR